MPAKKLRQAQAYKLGTDHQFIAKMLEGMDVVLEVSCRVFLFGMGAGIK